MVTSVTLTSIISQTVNCSTSVTFKELTDENQYYIDNYKPFDKQDHTELGMDWIINFKIEGSYFNVVGLPTYLLYQLFNTI